MSASHGIVPSGIMANEVVVLAKATRRRFSAEYNKKGTGHLLRSKPLELRRPGNDSATAALPRVPGDKGRSPDGLLGPPAAIAGVGAGLLARGAKPCSPRQRSP